MNVRLRSITVLAFAVSGVFFAACDSDDPAEDALVRFDGQYVAEVVVSGSARSAGAHGGCCYRITLDADNGATGVISGAGTVQELNQDGTDAGRSWNISVSGTTEGNRVEMNMPTEDDFPALAFEGTVSDDGDTIAGMFTSQFLGGLSTVFERVP